MRLSQFIFIILIIPVFSFSDPSPHYHITTTLENPNIIESEMMTWINTIRTTYDKSPITPSQNIRNAAYDYSKTFTKKSYAIKPHHLQSLLWKDGITDQQFYPYGIVSNASYKDILIKMKTGIISHLKTELLESSDYQMGLSISQNESHDAFIAMVIFIRKVTSLSPIPWQMSQGQTFSLSLNMNADYTDPEIVMANPNGIVTSSSLRSNAIGDYLFTSPALFQNGEYMVEVMVTNKSGPAIANLFPIFVNTPTSMPLEEVTITLSEKTSSHELETNLFKFINTDRTAHNLKPLTYNDRLARFAKDHNQDMLDHHYVGHTSPDYGDLSNRATEAKLSFKCLTENVAQNSSIELAHFRLMQSPSHKRNILDTRVTDVGISVIKKIEDNQPILVIVENFAQF